MGRVVARSDSGAAAVEFALISVVLFTLLFGIIQYGFYFFQATSVASFTSQAGRLAAVRDSCTAWQDDLDALADAGGASGRVSEVNVTGPASRGDLLTVTVEWEPTAMGVVPLPSADVNRQANVVRTERLGGISDAGCRWSP